jgi:TRAP-type C4-dicarboxylate transport system permease small subunit
LADKKTVTAMICRFTDKLIDFEQFLGIIFQMIFIAILAVQIFLRFVFNAPIYGIEEAVTCLVVWFAAFGSTVVYRENGHAQVEYFLRFVPPVFRKWLSVFLHVVAIVVSWMLIQGGWKLFGFQKKALPAGGLPFPKGYYYALPIVVMGISLILAALGHILKALRNRDKQREGGDII